MKRRIATLLTLALSVTLLGGCGGSSNTETTNNDSGNSSGGFLSEVTNSKSEVLSEVLSSGKVIAYKVDSVDKAETPDDIYFFNNGKVTIIPGEEFGLTMGDFSKMSDSEIWSSYETVKETYIEKYVSDKIESAKTSIESDIQIAEENLEFVASQKETFEAGLNGETEEIDYLFDIVLDWGLLTDSEIEQLLETGRVDSLSEATLTTILSRFDTRINEATLEITELQAKLDNLTCATPFCDMTVAFVIETDSSGNNVQNEKMVYPTQQYNPIEEIPTTLYETLSFAQGLTREEVIYDTTYNCIATTGSGSFLTREVMDLDDTLDGKYVLIDLNNDEINERFKEEVMARYE